MSAAANQWGQWKTGSWGSGDFAYPAEQATTSQKRSTGYNGYGYEYYVARDWDDHWRWTWQDSYYWQDEKGLRTGGDLFPFTPQFNGSLIEEGPARTFVRTVGSGWDNAWVVSLEGYTDPTAVQFTISNSQLLVGFASDSNPNVIADNRWTFFYDGTLQTFINGVFTPVTGGVGDTLRVERYGATITFKVNGVSVGSASDAGTDPVYFTFMANHNGASIYDVAFSEPEAPGQIAGTSTLTFVTAGVLAGSGTLAGTSPLTFTTAGILKGNGALSGSTSLTFSPTAAILGIAAGSGTTTLTFSTAGILTGRGALAGASTLTFSPAGVLAGRGALAGASALTFATAGILGGSGQLFGATSLTFSTAGAILGAGALSGATTLTFALAGVLADAGSPALRGSTSLACTTSGTLVGSGVLAGSTSLTVSLSATASSVGALAGSTSVTFSSAGNVIGLAGLSGSASFAFLLSGSFFTPVVDVPPSRIAVPGVVSRTARASPRVNDPEVSLGSRIVRPARRLA